MALGGALALIAGMVVGGVTSMILGFGAGLLAAVVAYFVTVSLQSKILVKRGYPAVYRVPPKHIRNIWKGFNLRTARPEEND